MQDAFGGILNITIVAVFFILVSSILAMTVNYTKAFKMKNYVISTIEQYEGSGCGCTGERTTNTLCISKIKNYASDLGYAPKMTNCNGNGDRPIDGLFCCGKSESSENLSSKQLMYSVTTQVDIDFPLIDKLMGTKALQVHGDTRIITK